MKANREAFNRSLRALNKRDRAFIKGNPPAAPHDAIRLKIVTDTGAAMLSASIDRLSRETISAYPPKLV